MSAEPMLPPGKPARVNSAAPNRRRRVPWFSYLLSAWVWCGVCFLVAPILLVFLNSVGTERFVTFPPRGFTLTWYGQIAPVFYRSFLFSLVLGLLASAGGIVLGVPAALAVVRGRIPGRPLIEAFLKSPMQVPMLVSGVAFLQYYNLIYSRTGFALVGSLGGLLIAHIAVVTPYVFTTVSARLMKMDLTVEEAAYGLGASPRITFFQITMPMIRPAIFSGAFFAFLMSFDNVPLSLFLVGTNTNTFPIQLFASVDYDLSRMNYAVATLATLFSTGLILAYQKITGSRSPMIGGGG